MQIRWGKPPRVGRLADSGWELSRNAQRRLQGMTPYLTHGPTRRSPAGILKSAGRVFIVGGAEIYRQAMHLTNRIYLTIVHHSFDADTFFPEIDYSEWKELAREDHETDEKHAFAYSFITLEKP